MTDEELREIEERAEKASPGPWKEDAWAGTDSYDDPDSPFVVVSGMDNPDEENRWSPRFVDTPAAIQAWQDASFIAHAREDIPALIAEIKRLRESKYLSSIMGSEIW